MVPILSWGREVLALALKTLDFVFVCRFLILERGGVQKTRSVDYPQNGNCFSPEAKHASVPAIKQHAGIVSKEMSFSGMRGHLSGKRSSVAIWDSRRRINRLASSGLSCAIKLRISSISRSAG